MDVHREDLMELVVANLCKKNNVLKVDGTRILRMEVPTTVDFIVWERPPWRLFFGDDFL